MSNQLLSEAFRRFAENECRGSSALYASLSEKTADDPPLLELAAHAGAGQPVPNLLFGAVHYLLLQGASHPLRRHYPSVVKQPEEDYEEAYVLFQDFCRNYRENLITLLQTKRVQTNEVRRCSYLFPVFSYVYERIQKPLALVEIGTSAGLQLLWDQYRYTYYPGGEGGKRDSPVHIEADVRGDALPILPRELPPVASRTGIDLHTMDVTKEEDVDWLTALIWPEHHDRRELFQQAAACAAAHELHLIEGDAVSVLHETAAAIPETHCLCVFHTHVANQMTEEAKADLFHLIASLGTERDICHIYNNMQDKLLHVDYYVDGQRHEHTIGNVDGHGRWFEWRISDEGRRRGSIASAGRSNHQTD
ncbi:DUF2332 domain-containing protein [Alkalicoccus chagannorensis]|uniref:DUF2332 domain-containing protein n=1 Tax=Alkalicoccus chagannorensis TaxID=427072 RepID=UPI00040A18BD|nr:DUF2332 domain-containing protein [Alkalicoccus chagannorensis]